MSLRPAVESVRMAKQLALSTDMSRAGIKELALRLAAEGLAEQIAHGTDITPEGRMTVARALLARQLSPRC